MIKESEQAIKKYELRENSDLERLKKHTQEITDYIKGIEKQNISLGLGRTAEVFGSKSDPRICYKLIHSREYYVNDVEKEGEFLYQTSEIQKEGVRTPKPYYSIKYGDYHVLAMERLDAVSVKDILDNKAELPVNFNFTDFFKKISSFLKEMNSQKIYHRDIHAGNVMVDNKTGCPRIIDFGCSKKTRLGSEKPYQEESQTGKVILYTNDLDGLTRVRNELGAYIMKNKK